MPDFTAVKGFLTPAMVEHLPGGRTLNAFADIADIKQIQAGYACGECCATFHSFQLECPLCGKPTDVTRQMQDAPKEWQAHVDQRSKPIPTRGPGPREQIEAEQTLPRSPEEFLASLANDQGVDHIPLSKLGPRRNRSGR